MRNALHELAVFTCSFAVGVAAHIRLPSWWTSGGVALIVVELLANLSAVSPSYAAAMCSLLWMAKLAREVQHYSFSALPCPPHQDGVKFELSSVT